MRSMQQISFGSTYKIRCAGAKQAANVVKNLPKGIDFVQNSADGIVINTSKKNNKAIFDVLQKA